MVGNDRAERKSSDADRNRHATHVNADADSKADADPHAEADAHSEADADPHAEADSHATPTRTHRDADPEPLVQLTKPGARA